MNPKDAAYELYEKFFNEFDFSEFLDDGECAKKCATIVVDNIISIEFRNFEMNAYNELDYWNEVKLELENL